MQTQVNTIQNQNIQQLPQPVIAITNYGHENHHDEQTEFLKSNIGKSKQKVIQDQQNKIKNDNKNPVVLVGVCMLLLCVILKISINFTQVALYLVQTFDLFQIEKHSEQKKNFAKLLMLSQQADQFIFEVSKTQRYMVNNRMPYCPSVQSVFHVQMNDSQKTQKMSRTSQIRAQVCHIPVLKKQNLQQLVQKWNTQSAQSQPPAPKIDLILTKQNRLLLILLHMYFNAGTFIDSDINYSSISNKCWKYTLTGTDLMFSQFEEKKNDKNIYIPKFNNFIRARYPYSSMVRRMVSSLARNQDHMEECRNRQCLVVKCQIQHY